MDDNTADGNAGKSLCKCVQDNQVYMHPENSGK